MHSQSKVELMGRAYCEFKQKWRTGLNHRISRDLETAPKPEGQNLPQWKRKQEQEKKPEESERKIEEPLWKRIRETEKKQEQMQESQKIQKDVNQNEKTEAMLERQRPEPLWKKKKEPERLVMRLEPNSIFKKQERVKIQEPATQQEQELAKRHELHKIEPVRKLEPLWKRKFEPVKKPEPEIKRDIPVKKMEPIWKRKIEVEAKPEPTTKQEPGKTTEPKIKEAFVKKIEPLWKRKIEPEEKQELKTIKQEPVKKIEPLWKRKIVTEEKHELKNTKQEPVKKTEPLWKKKKEPEQKTESPKKPDSPTKNKPKNEDKNKNKALSPEEETEDPPEEDDTEELLCPICSELFDEEDHQPVLLARCGHTFCRPCLVTIKGRGHFPCPTCRKRHIKPPVEDLPVHSEILSRANAYRNDKTGKCQTHQELLVYWCRECQAPLCSSCRVMNGHNIVRTRVVLQEMRQEMKESGQTILDNVLEEKRKIMETVKTCSVQLLKACEESVGVDGSSQDVQDMLTDTKQTADLSFVLRSLERMKSILGFFSKAAIDPEPDENTTPKSRRRKDRRLTEQSGDASTHQDTKTPETKITPNPAEDKRETTKLEKDVTGMHKTIGRKQPAVGGVRGSVPADVMRDGPLVCLADAALWPLTCCVYTENGRRARLARQGGRLHMSALTESEEEAHFMIKLSVIQGVIPHDHPEVFLEVAAGERRLGTITIRLWGHLRRAHNFLALCMGTHGPSYRGAKFEEVFSRGLKGECLHAGPYPTPTGDLTARRVMDALEWDGEFKVPQRKGMVVGAGSGLADRDSCFDICTIENPTRHFACPFGEVVDGWDAVAAILNHRPIRGVTMVDVGVVVPGGVLTNT
ncbi:E3 ubiquitin-protein ligase TRIM17 [Chionoecetes opilio]|uniref:E3 ubiquitin-protein ligase TRIM17 n=1 Tax=Chionoecetes opilio TaxID=41210 RepID=A0A8J4Y666_CHIOP|nr:E3 ubiquitin-protein ligase TRIM17 [Chionoecetes opilio]